MIKFRIKQEVPQVDDERLIMEVKAHPFLYDTRSSDYRNLPMRATVWNEIAKNLDIEDQMVVQKRWKVLREKFSVAYRKNVLEEISSNWIYYDFLTFLEPFVNLKPEGKKLEKLDELNISDHDSKSLVLSKSPLDEHILIKLVKERPVLYDKKHEDFRVANARKKAWDEISEIVNWDIDTLQKRWRVMRDRFVRELRRSKNAEVESQLNCSAFFRDMLFLTHHVRSKTYEVEANFDDSEDYNWQEEVEQIEISKIKKERMALNEIETTHIQMMGENDQMYEQYLDDNDELEHEVEYDGTMVEEVEPQDDEYIEEIVDGSQHEQDHDQDVNSGNDEPYEELLQNQYIKNERVKPKIGSVVVKKRRISNTDDEFHTPAVKSQRLVESILLGRTSTAVTSMATDTSDNDEDLAFGSTIGCMLKKVPQHLKTSAKLKLLQSFAEFELQHKLS